MRRAKQLLLHTSAMTATSLLMRTIALVFQVYVAGKIGAAGIGLFQLVMSVYTLATTVAVSGVRLAATRLIAQQTGRGDDAAIRSMAANDRHPPGHRLRHGICCFFRHGCLTAALLSGACGGRLGWG